MNIQLPLPPEIGARLLLLAKMRIKHLGGPGSGPQKHSDPFASLFKSQLPPNNPHEKSYALHKGYQEGFGDLYDIVNGSQHGNTVGEETVKKLGLEKRYRVAGGPGSGPRPGEGKVRHHPVVGKGDPEKVFGMKKEEIVSALIKGVGGDVDVQMYGAAKAGSKGPGYVKSELDASIKLDAKNYQMEVSKHGEIMTVESLVVDPSLRNTDTAMRLLDNVVSMTKDSKMSSVDFGANLDKGGYAWARIGAITPDPNGLAKTVSDRLESAKDNSAPKETAPNLTTRDATTESIESLHGLSAESRSALSDFVEKNKNSEDLPRQLSELKIDGKNVGRFLLRGTSWKGRFRVDDNAAMARFKHFVRT